MASVQKIINLGSIEEDLTLIALHSPLEDFALAYAINRHFQAKLKRLAKDLELGNHAHFPIFEWNDDINDRNWLLVANHCMGEPATSYTGDLFAELPSPMTYTLVPEYREVDFVLKLESENLWDARDIARQLGSIPRITAAYTLDSKKLKSKNNLIF